MSTQIGRFRPGLVFALVKVAMISTWRGRTFLDDDRDLADIADFVPEELTAPVRLPVAEPAVLEQPNATPVAGPGHSVAA